MQFPLKNWDLQPILKPSRTLPFRLSGLKADSSFPVAMCYQAIP
jgi:hypothetical protein